MLAGIGGQHGWRDPIRLICDSVLWRRWRLVGRAGRRGAFWGERGERGEMVAALSRDRQRRGEADGRQAAELVGRTARLAAGADRGGTGRDVAGAGGRARGARRQIELLRCLALLRERRHQFQKKACAPANRTARTSPADARAGRRIRTSLIPGASSSSTRPGPRPI